MIQRFIRVIRTPAAVGYKNFRTRHTSVKSTWVPATYSVLTAERITSFAARSNLKTAKLAVIICNGIIKIKHEDNSVRRSNNSHYEKKHPWNARFMINRTGEDGIFRPRPHPEALPLRSRGGPHRCPLSYDAAKIRKSGHLVKTKSTNVRKLSTGGWGQSHHDPP